MEETELDMSKQGLKAGDAVLLASDIPDMGALASLDITGNFIGSEQEAIIRQICTEKSITLTCEGAIIFSGSDSDY